MGAFSNILDATLAINFKLKEQKEKGNVHKHYKN